MTWQFRESFHMRPSATNLRIATIVPTLPVFACGHQTLDKVIEVQTFWRCMIIMDIASQPERDLTRMHQKV